MLLSLGCFSGYRSTRVCLVTKRQKLSRSGEGMIQPDKPITASDIKRHKTKCIVEQENRGAKGEMWEGLLEMKNC